MRRQPVAGLSSIILLPRRVRTGSCSWRRHSGMAQNRLIADERHCQARQQRVKVQALRRKPQGR